MVLYFSISSQKGFLLEAGLLLETGLLLGWCISLFAFLTSSFLKTKAYIDSIYSPLLTITCCHLLGKAWIPFSQKMRGWRLKEASRNFFISSSSPKCSLAKSAASFLKR